MSNEGLGSWMHRRRIKSRDKVAIIGSGVSVTYDEFDRNINALAHALREAGIDKGDRVAYLGENHPAFLEVFFAATELGAIFVPLNTRLAAPELHYMLEDSGSSMLIHADALSDLASRAAVGIDGIRLAGDNEVTVAGGEIGTQTAVVKADAGATGSGATPITFGIADVADTTVSVTERSKFWMP